jgi:hypothetical protein
MLQISEIEHISFFSFFFFLVLLDSLYQLAIYWLLGLSSIGYWLVQLFVYVNFFTKKVKNWSCFFLPNFKVRNESDF